jgi:hypothetical protein
MADLWHSLGQRRRPLRPGAGARLPVMWAIALNEELGDGTLWCIIDCSVCIRENEQVNRYSGALCRPGYHGLRSTRGVNVDKRAMSPPQSHYAKPFDPRYAGRGRGIVVVATRTRAGDGEGTPGAHRASADYTSVLPAAPKMAANVSSLGGRGSCCWSCDGP